MTAPVWANPDDNPRRNAYHAALAEAANLTDAQLQTALADVANSVAYAQRLADHAAGRRIGLLQAQHEREASR